MRPDVRRMLLIQAGNLLLLAIAAGVIVTAVDALTAYATGARDEPDAGGALAWISLAGSLAVMVLAILAYRWTARGERYAPLFAVLGWAVLWLPLSLALGAASGTPLLAYLATLVCGAGIVLSLVALGSKKPR
ncbi:hypothetical protein [Arthrobacter sulfonylureivorans]|uniref:Uncharacterized protein n=1 Tax=Arthrobacter sulfonylureivorans TaxID=2486855 RepID=A0ABY3W8U6_9MICC|nr:hypothetical protein [Arthrobacter sulfonylureivorans]UNK45877.1 hypothetical protein MNQ99_00350 [Arthrobacter sulfonylureivorans]